MGQKSKHVKTIAFYYEVSNLDVLLLNGLPCFVFLNKGHHSVVLFRFMIFTINFLQQIRKGFVRLQATVKSRVLSAKFQQWRQEKQRNELRKDEEEKKREEERKRAAELVKETRLYVLKVFVWQNFYCYNIIIIIIIIIIITIIVIIIIIIIIIVIIIITIVVVVVVVTVIE